MTCQGELAFVAKLLEVLRGPCYFCEAIYCYLCNVGSWCNLVTIEVKRSKQRNPVKTQMKLATNVEV